MIPAVFCIIKYEQQTGGDGMKRIVCLLLCAMTGLAAGCREAEEPAGQAALDELTVRLSDGTEFPLTEMKDFFYTYDNINYNAVYQRYRFYTEDGKLMFYHETREVKGNYGPAEEKDIKKKGTISLSAKRCAEFAAYLQEGTAKEREELVEDGDSGPWMYLYLINGDPKGLEFRFSSYEKELAFKDFCAKLAAKGK